MATRNLVPRNSGEGSVGKLDQAWGSGVFDNLFVSGLDIFERVCLLLASCHLYKRCIVDKKYSPHFTSDQAENLNNY